MKLAGRLAFLVALLPGIAFTPAARAAIPTSQRDALVAFYNATGGPQWTNHSGWLGATGTECTWYGIECNENETSVKTIDVSSNNVSGSLPSSLFSALPDLEVFIAIGNAIGGTIPSSIGSLAKLVYLDLGENQLTGPIPDSLTHLPAIQTLDLNTNGLTGPIPPSLSSLTTLRELLLSYNELTGPIPPQLGTLPNLEQLDLSSNLLGGSIPPELGGLTNLTELTLSEDNLTGPIPRELGNLRNLRYLTLDYNTLTGTIPEELSNLTSLLAFSAYDNNIGGPIPPSLGRLTNLEYLDLSFNELSGTIPVELTQLTNLRLLGLGNLLTGNIPPAIGNLRNLIVLDLSVNQLTGPIPDSFSSMTQLAELLLQSNRLSGEIPPSITQLTELEYLFLGDNELTGPIPSSIGSLRNLLWLYLSYNFLDGTIPASAGDLTKLEHLEFQGNMLTGSIPPTLGNDRALLELLLDENLLTGPIPPQLGQLTNLTILALSWNGLTGTIPPELSSLTALQMLLVGGNQLSGTIPPGISALTNLGVLDLYGNQLSGAIPPTIGQLTNLQSLFIGCNQLSGLIPPQITSLVNLQPSGGLDVSYNSLETNDAAVRSFVNSKVSDNDFEATQNLGPTNFAVSAVLGTSVILTWNRIRYYGDEGGYEIEVSRTSGGAAEQTVMTSDKELTSAFVNDLTPEATYYFRVRAVTFPHGDQQSELASDWSAAVQARTEVNPSAAAHVIITMLPYGMVQDAGRAEAGDYFVLTNVGDIPSSVTLTPSGDFFVLERTTAVIAPHDSEYFGINALARPAGVYRGSVAIDGHGVESGTAVRVELLSAVPAAGTVIAEASATRVDVMAPPGVNPTGSVAFTNTGTATLTGIAVADVPWILPAPDIVTIAAGATATVPFSIDRSLRPDAADLQGAASGNFSLVYAGNLIAKEDILANPAGSSSSVMIVDNVLATVVSSVMPPLAAGEIAFVIPGVRQTASAAGTVLSDVALANAFGTQLVSGVSMFYGRSGTGAPAAVSNLGSLSVGESVKLSDVVRSVYGQQSQVGAVHIRTPNSSWLSITAKVMNATNRQGTYGTLLPAFRSDRAAVASQSIVLTGVRSGGGFSTELFLQEMAGSSAAVQVVFLDANGAAVGSARAADNLSAFGFVQLAGVVPAGAVTATLTVAGAGKVAAYAVVTDSVTGDSWTVNDWSRYFAYSQKNTVLVPAVGAISSHDSRRRPVRRPAPLDDTAGSTQFLTDLTLYNIGAEDAVVTLQYRDGGQISKTMTLPAHATQTIADLTSWFGRSSSSRGYVIIDSHNDAIAVSARLYRTTANGSFSTAIPVLQERCGMRSGQVRIFPAIDDSTNASMRAERGGTFSTSLLLVETAGKSATVRATLAYADGKSLAGLAGERWREFPVAANSFLVIPNIGATILGSSRETLGDLSNVALKVQVVNGDGSVVPLVNSIDNGTKDPVLRSE